MTEKSGKKSLYGWTAPLAVRSHSSFVSIPLPKERRWSREATTQQKKSLYGRSDPLAVVSWLPHLNPLTYKRDNGVQRPQLTRDNAHTDISTQKKLQNDGKMKKITVRTECRDVTIPIRYWGICIGQYWYWYWPVLVLVGIGIGWYWYGIRIGMVCYWVVLVLVWYWY